MSHTRFVMVVLLASVAAVLVVFFGVGSLLARDWQVETVRTLRGDGQRLAALVRDLAVWPQWAAIAIDRGPQTERSIVGAPGSGEQRIVWKGPRGDVALVANAVGERSIDYWIGTPDAASTPWARGHLEWQVEGDGCRVRWVEGGPFEDLVMRWIGWFGAAQERVKQIQGSSLVALQQELEKPPAAK